MTAENLGPRVATADDVPDVVAILVSALYDDPTWNWAFPDPARRAEQHRRLWGLFVKGAMRYPHYFLSLLGTSAEHRCRGYGLGLLAANGFCSPDLDPVG